MTVNDTKTPTVGWQKLFGEHHQRLSPFKVSRWQRETPETIAAKKMARDECALEAASAQLAEGFDALKPGIVWSRPAAIPADDSVLIWHLKVAQGRAGKASKEIATDFWRWRAHVLDVEREDGAKVLMLMRSIVELIDVQEGLGVGCARAPIDFVDAHYGHHIGATLAPARLPEELPREIGDTRAEFSRLVYRLTRREAVLPTWLAWFGSFRIPEGIRPRGPSTQTKNEAEEKQDAQDEEW